MRKLNPAKMVLWMLMAVLTLVAAHSQAPASGAVPEDARRCYVQANTRFKEAQSPEDYKQAVALYQQALQAAPHFGNAWYNLSKAQEKLLQYDDAIASLKHFLAESPNDPEARTAQDHVYELEVKRDDLAKADATRKQAEDDKAARQRDALQKLESLRQMYAGLKLQHFETCFNPARMLPGGIYAGCTDGDAAGSNWHEASINGGSVQFTLTGADGDIIKIVTDNNGPKLEACIKASDFPLNMWFNCNTQRNISIVLGASFNNNTAILDEECNTATPGDCSVRQRFYYVLGR